MLDGKLAASSELTRVRKVIGTAAFEKMVHESVSSVAVTMTRPSRMMTAEIVV
jgi:hypothetical protein